MGLESRELTLLIPTALHKTAAAVDQYASCMLQLSLCQTEECSELDVGNDGEPESGQHRVHDAKFSSYEAGDKINDCVNFYKAV